MRLPNSAHTSRPWGSHELTPDFRVEDAWAPPEVGGPDDFPRVVKRLASYDPARSSSFVTRSLFAIRWRLGELFGWDRASSAIGGKWAAEAANQTMHGVMHIGRVPHEGGGFGVQLAVLVQPNDLLGDAYMAGTRPFRYLIVYPAIVREMGRMWRAAVPV